jgi:hypothetical protein
VKGQSYIIGDPFTGFSVTGGVPREEGLCQASYSKRRDGFRRLRCLHPDCRAVVEGFDIEKVVVDWNEHIIYRRQDS